MRVDLVDPPAFSPPYDDALARALASAGASVRLVTSSFAYGAVPTPDGYVLDERFYRRASGAAGSRTRQLTKLVSHVPDMLRYLHRSPADVIHFEWLAVPELDLRLLPARRPVVLTIHDPLQRESSGHRIPRLRLGHGAFHHVDAVVVHSEYARGSVIDSYGLEPERVHVIPHGALGELPAPGPLPAELAVDPGRPVVLCFGLIRPYKGVEALLEAWRAVSGADLWIVGRPMTDIAALIAGAPATVKFLPRFVSDAEQAAVFARADVVVLPYERSERFGFSGVLATALGLGKAIVLSDIGGFSEVGAIGAAQMVPPGDVAALGSVLEAVIADPAERARLGVAALSAAHDQYSWKAAARATLELYEKICA